MLQPLSTASTQLWIPLTPVQPVLAPTLWRSVQRDIRPNPPLPSAQLELVNSHRYALRVLVGDSRKGNQTETVRIEPNSSEQVMLDRDAGSTLVETVEVRSSNGGWDRQTFTTQIPPIGYYDLSVYEEHLQSIAIDRTGKSPNPIEDINYVPRSIGWLSLPVGADLPERGRMDIYNQAKAARNPGAVRRLSLDELEGESERPSPIETILEEFQSVPRRSF